MDETGGCRRAAFPALAAGFAAIYLIWGSTYLAMRFAVESLPPFLMGGVRFVLAGLVLYGLRRWQGVTAPPWGTWGWALASGALLFVGGNGLVAWGQQQHVPSGMTALLIATTAIWMALLAWLLEGGRRPSLRTTLGIALGFLGAVLLIRPGDGVAGPAPSFLGILAVLGAPITWSLGSILTRRGGAERDPILASGMQMIAGGALMLLVGTGLGETVALDAHAISLRSALAWLYLLVFGSLIAFSTYTWLLHNTSATAVATYAYVNPLVAVLLGWLFAGEVIDQRVLLAAALIVLAVVLITAPPMRFLARRAPTDPVPALCLEGSER